MSYSVERIAEPREPFGPYRYRILLDGREVAVFTHDFRGECESIRTADGYEEDPPFGMSSEFLSGGPRGPGLTSGAAEYLEGLLHGHPTPRYGNHRDQPARPCATTDDGVTCSDD